MRSALTRLAVPLVGYGLGMIPSADVASRLAGGPNLRSAGSGNPGATNAAAVLGARYGLAVLAVDITKGAVASRLGQRWGGATGAQLAGTAAVVGHCYPAWNGFHGGKGVATSVGQVLATLPVYAPIDAAVAVATAASPRWKRRAFAATTVSSAVWVAGATLWWRRGWSTGWGPEPTVALPLGALASSLVIYNRFRTAAPPEAGPDPREDWAPGAGAAEGRALNGSQPHPVVEQS
ncbi:MAG: glycerol-3-phosphate acyltransferase [Actinomycetota bacterium]